MHQIKFSLIPLSISNYSHKGGDIMSVTKSSGICVVVCAVVLVFLLAPAASVAVQARSEGCITGDSGIDPPFPFDVGDGNDYGNRRLELTVPDQCKCEPDDAAAGNCTPCPIVIGFHGFGQDGSFWKERLEPKGAAVGFISLYPTGDKTDTGYLWDNQANWAVPSCQYPDDGCLGIEGIPCDWCGDTNEDEADSSQREIDFVKAIVEWTMENYCVDPDQIFATGYSNGGLMVHELARNPETSGLFKAVVAMDGVDQAGKGVDPSGKDDKLRWIYAPQRGNSPWILHVNEIFDRFEPYDGMPYIDFAGAPGRNWNPIWIYPPVLQIFAKYAADNNGYSACGFGPNDVGNRNGELAVGGVVPEGYRRLDGANSLEGEGQNKFFCFTKDAQRGGQSCEKLAICLWDHGERGDDVGDTHYPYATNDWRGGTDPGTGGTEPMDIMWRFMQASVGVPY
jgi:predicted esterase